MSSITLSITGDKSQLHADFYPEIELDKRYNYSCSLLDFYTYNSIPNVHENNNVFHYSLNGANTWEKVVIPVGSYELENIIKIITDHFQAVKANFYLHANPNTMKCKLEGSIYVDFTQPNSIGSLLGFNKRILEASKIHTSDKLVDIQSVNNIRIECDLITGSFHNGKSTHTIYEFNPIAGPGCKINEQPKHLIYLPVIKRSLNEVNISIVDQNGHLVNFRGEEITCRIHLKKDL